MKDGRYVMATTPSMLLHPYALLLCTLLLTVVLNPIDEAWRIAFGGVMQLSSVFVGLN